MISSDFRAEARKRLTNKWGKALIITLLYTIIVFIIGGIDGFINQKTISVIISLALLIIEIPIIFGISFSYYKLFNGNAEDVKPFDFITLGFKNFKKAWGIVLWTLLKLIVPIILIIAVTIIIIISVGASIFTASSPDSLFASLGATAIIGSIAIIVLSIWLTMKSYYYTMTNYIAFDNLEIPSKEIVEKSKTMMEGNRAKLFILQLTFIGWALLSIITCGIGYLFLFPYIQFAIIAFYKYVSNNNIETSPKEENN